MFEAIGAVNYFIDVPKSKLIIADANGETAQKSTTGIWTINLATGRTPENMQVGESVYTGVDYVVTPIIARTGAMGVSARVGFYRPAMLPSLEYGIPHSMDATIRAEDLTEEQITEMRNWVLMGGLFPVKIMDLCLVDHAIFFGPQPGGKGWKGPHRAQLMWADWQAYCRAVWGAEAYQVVEREEKT